MSRIHGDGRKSQTHHGMANTPEYKIWAAMKDRCYNTKCNRWSTHGARGVKVCDRWLDDFSNFIADMGVRPGKEFSLERIDNNGNYAPENCRWATDTEQAENRRTTKLITIGGKTQSLKAWCRQLEIPYLRTWKRLYMYGWSLESSITG